MGLVGQLSNIFVKLFKLNIDLYVMPNGFHHPLTFQEGLTDPATLDFNSKSFVVDMEHVLFGINERIGCLSELFEEYVFGAAFRLDKSLRDAGYATWSGDGDVPILHQVGGVDVVRFMPGRSTTLEDQELLEQICYDWMNGFHPDVLKLDENIVDVQKFEAHGVDRLSCKARAFKEFGLPEHIDYVRADVVLPNGKYTSLSLDDSGLEAVSSPESDTLVFKVLHPTVQAGVTLSSGAPIIHPDMLALMVASDLHCKINGFAKLGNLDALFHGTCVEYPDESCAIIRKADLPFNEAPKSYLKRVLYSVSPQVYHKLFPYADSSLRL